MEGDGIRIASCVFDVGAVQWRQGRVRINDEILFVHVRCGRRVQFRPPRWRPPVDARLERTCQSPATDADDPSTITAAATVGEGTRDRLTWSPGMTLVHSSVVGPMKAGFMDRELIASYRQISD
jgi:hypothetical protein